MSERIHPISMPKWGMTMTEGKVAGWLVREGDAVEPGLDVVEIETEKITNVMDTPASGVVRRVVVPAGATATVGHAARSRRPAGRARGRRRCLYRALCK